MITNAAMRALSENGEGMGAYRKLAEHMQRAVVALGEAPGRARRARKSAEAIEPEIAPQQPTPESPERSHARNDRARHSRGAKA